MTLFRQPIFEMWGLCEVFVRSMWGVRAIPHMLNRLKCKSLNRLMWGVGTFCFKILLSDYLKMFRPQDAPQPLSQRLPTALLPFAVGSLMLCRRQTWKFSREFLNDTTFQSPWYAVSLSTKRRIVYAWIRYPYCQITRLCWEITQRYWRITFPAPTAKGSRSDRQGFLLRPGKPLASCGITLILGIGGTSEVIRRNIGGTPWVRFWCSNEKTFFVAVGFIQLRIIVEYVIFLSYLCSRK